jgi:hypothetical protein
MPYISQERRKALFNESPDDDDYRIHNAGELNYMITYIIKEYVHQQGEKYQVYNDVIGALEGAKMEMYRRHVSVYEDVKLEANGDVIVADGSKL